MSQKHDAAKEIGTADQIESLRIDFTTGGELSLYPKQISGLYGTDLTGLKSDINAALAPVLAKWGKVFTDRALRRIGVPVES